MVFVQLGVLPLYGLVAGHQIFTQFIDRVIGVFGIQFTIVVGIVLFLVQRKSDRIINQIILDQHKRNITRKFSQGVLVNQKVFRFESYHNEIAEAKDMFLKDDNESNKNVLLGICNRRISSIAENILPDLQVANETIADILNNPEIISLIIQYVTRYRNYLTEIRDKEAILPDEVDLNWQAMDDTKKMVVDYNSVFQSEVPTAMEVKEQKDAIHATWTALEQKRDKIRDEQSGENKG